MSKGKWSNNYPKVKIHSYNYCKACKRRWYNSSTKLDFIKCPLCESNDITTRIDNTEGKLQIPYFRGEDY